MRTAVSKSRESNSCMPLGRASVLNQTKYVDMRNRMMYIGKPQIIVEQQLFHNNLTFNTLTSKI
jgi:hypothetical protein